MVEGDEGGFMRPSSLSHDWANTSRVLGLTGPKGARQGPLPPRSHKATVHTAYSAHDQALSAMTSP